MSTPPPDDPFLEAEIDRALGPYRRKGFPPAALEEMKRVLRLALLSHPRAQYLIDRLRPRAEKASGKVDTNKHRDLVDAAGRAKDGSGGEGA
jgi:hypothetical protein